MRRLALAFPGVEEGLSYGTPGFRVRGKFLARLWEDGEGYPTVLVRLASVTRTELQGVLEQARRLHAPRRLVREYEQAQES